MWVRGDMSNFDYLMFLNGLSGRRAGDSFHPPILPWVADLSSNTGGWRDLTKSKYRLSKGDEMLDITFQSSNPHHLTDMLSSVTYCIYAARRLEVEVLKRVVRAKFEPNEYPSSIQRMFQWTPDECIPEFFTDPEIFKSIHPDMEDLGIPDWASSPSDFVHRHMKMLESDEVSAQLHHWIDLCFGYKLSGDAARDAKNVVLARDLRVPAIGGISHLFTAPHPPRTYRRDPKDVAASYSPVSAALNPGPLNKPHATVAEVYMPDVLASVDSPPIGTPMMQKTLELVEPSTPQQTSAFSYPSSATHQAAWTNGPEPAPLDVSRNRTRVAASVQPIAFPPGTTNAHLVGSLATAETQFAFVVQHSYVWPQYMPPACADLPSDDVFGVGAIAAHMYNEQAIFDRRTMPQVFASANLTSIDKLPASAREFVRKLTMRQANLRPSAIDALRDEFFPPYFGDLHSFLSKFHSLPLWADRLQHVVSNLHFLLLLPHRGFKLALPVCLELLAHRETRIEALRLLDALTGKLGMDEAVALLGGHIERLLSAEGDEALQLAILDGNTITVILRRLGSVYFDHVVQRYVLQAMRNGGAAAMASARAAAAAIAFLGPAASLASLLPALLRAISTPSSAASACEAFSLAAGSLGEQTIARYIFPAFLQLVNTNSNDAILLPCLSTMARLAPQITKQTAAIVAGSAAARIAQLLRTLPTSCSDAAAERLAGALVAMCSRIGVELAQQTVFSHVCDCFRAYNMYHACAPGDCAADYRFCCFLCKGGVPIQAHTPQLLQLLYTRMVSLFGREVLASNLSNEAFLAHIIRAHSNRDLPLEFPLSDDSDGQTVSSPEVDRINWEAIQAADGLGESSNWEFQGATLHTMRLHSGGIKMLDVADRERLVVSASKDCTVKCWNLDRVACSMTYRGHTEAVVGACFLEHGAAVASCDKSVHIWDSETGRRRLKFRGTPVLCFAPLSPTVLVTATQENTVRLLDTREGQQRQEWHMSPTPGYVRAVAVDPDWRFVAVALSTGHINLFEPRTGLALDLWKAHDGAINKLEAISGGRVLSASADRTVVLWNVNSSPPTCATTYKGHSDGVSSLAIVGSQVLSAAGSKIGSAPLQGVGVIRMTNMRELKKMPLRGNISALAYLPLSHTILAGLDDGQIRICL
eukprot:TRINITY_DN3675_c0_g1_i2.p1 TRINITY_DN3675_c0_g1~~TRINITY_DN3675_c0_g1_i2.p1  ORF type:complete len:1155 (+),score=186.25 TRINITY_DN3675_c0_g1_i2:110-3574(+)